MCIEVQRGRILMVTIDLLCSSLLQLFSGSSEYVQQAERTSCISYDQYSNEVCPCTA